LKFKDYLEIIGDGIIIAAGITYVIIFVQIYFLGLYGTENNPWILKVEMIMGPVFSLLGIYLLIRDASRIIRRNSSK
jgi:hypothetical protein